MQAPYGATIVPPYPLDAFLSPAKSAAYEVWQYVQAPDALVGMAMVNAISMACQGLVDVRLPTGQLRPVTQNLLIIAASGERKSTVYSLILSPFRDADRRAVASYQDKVKKYQSELCCWQARRDGIARAIKAAEKKGEDTAELQERFMDHAMKEPLQPRLRYFLRQDITPKAIVEALQGDGESIALSTDEGHLLFQGAAMKHLGLLNTLWDSPDVMPLDRAKDQHVVPMNPRASVCILTQEAVLIDYMRKHGAVAKGSGHLARYLVGWPVSTQGYRVANQREPSWEHLPAFHARVSDLLEAYRSRVEAGAVERDVVEFSEDARARWFELASLVEPMLREGEYLGDINDFASKVPEILGRLAAAFHYFGGHGGKLALDTLERAFTIIRWHIEEAKRLFSRHALAPQEQIDAQAVADYLRDCVWRGGYYIDVPKNQVLRNGPVRDRTRLNAALQLLEAWRAVSVWVGPKDKKSYVRLNSEFFGTHASL